MQRHSRAAGADRGTGVERPRLGGTGSHVRRQTVPGGRLTSLRRRVIYLRTAQQQNGARGLQRGRRLGREAVGGERVRRRGRLLGQRSSQRCLPLLGRPGHPPEQPGRVGGELQAETSDRLGNGVDLRIRRAELTCRRRQRTEVAVGRRSRRCHLGRGLVEPGRRGGERQVKGDLTGPGHRKGHRRRGRHRATRCAPGSQHRHRGKHGSNRKRNVRAQPATPARRRPGTEGSAVQLGAGGSEPGGPERCPWHGLCLSIDRGRGLPRSGPAGPTPQAARLCPYRPRSRMGARRSSRQAAKSTTG